MIRYALICDKRHEFESWFADSASYGKQLKRGLVACPACGSMKIEKAIMAPSLKRRDKSARPSEPPSHEQAAPETEKSTVAIVPEQEGELRKKLKELRDHLTKNSDYVGPRFPEEARRMHYGEIDHRSIYGEASVQDAKELHDEGIEFHPLPTAPDDLN